MHYTHLRTVAVALLAAVVCSFAPAHVDDLKARDLLPPVYGQAYRAIEGGVAGETFSSNGMLLKSWLPLNVFPGSPTSGNDCWGYSSPSHREYAIIGLSNGTAFVEITDPSNAQIVALITGPTSLWRCVKTYGAYCYAGSEGGGGVQVISMTNIDGQNAGQPRVSLVGEITTGGSLNTHTLFVDTVSGYLYRAGGSTNGLRIYNLQPDPSAPVFVGQWSNVYVHEVQVVKYTSGPYAGKEIAFCCGGASSGHVNTGVYVVDCTNKANPVQLSYTTYPGAKFCHQSWLSNDATRIYINDELDEGDTTTVTTTIVMNVANLNAPFVEGTFTNGNPSVGHNLYIKGTKLFEANYRSGVRVFDLAQSATTPPEVAFFDTWPGDDGPQFNGLWNIWPFYPSGTIIGSDINRGLFVWRLGTNPGTFAFPNGLPSLVSPAGEPVTIQVTPVAGQSIPADGVKMRVTVGQNTTVTTMTALGNFLYRANFPATPCTTQLSYSFEVVVGGDTFTDPSGLHLATSAAGILETVNDTCEALGGWSLSAAGDNATTGQWINADPVGTSAQPEDDHTVTGTKCFVTGNGPVGGSVGAADVDGGSTTLTTPIFSGLGDETYVSYWRWYSNNQGAEPNLDSMPVDISNNGGSTWTQLELVTENAGAWVYKSFKIADYVTPTAQMRMRFIARDLAGGSIVEAGVDDVKVLGYDCTSSIPGDFNGDGIVDGADLGTLLSGWGQPGVTDLNGDGATDGADLGIFLGFWTTI